MDKTKTYASSPAWLENLIGPVYVDFIAPRSLEDAIRDLKGHETQGLFRLEKVHVDLIPQDLDTFRFTVTMRGYKKNRVQAQGLLKRWEEGTTHCTAQVNVAAYTYWMYLLVLLVVLPSIGLFLRVPWAVIAYGAFFAALLVINAYFARRRVEYLAQKLESWLHAS